MGALEESLKLATMSIKIKKYWYKIAKEKIGTTENCRCYVVVW